jgi:hypothetical protein
VILQLIELVANYLTIVVVYDTDTDQARIDLMSQFDVGSPVPTISQMSCGYIRAQSQKADSFVAALQEMFCDPVSALLVMWEHSRKTIDILLIAIYQYNRCLTDFESYINGSPEVSSIENCLASVSSKVTQYSSKRRFSVSDFADEEHGVIFVGY